MAETDNRKLALITGASGGIGEAFARVLAGEGYDLAIVARREEELNRVAGVLSGRQPVTVTPFVHDLSSQDAGSRLADELAERGQQPDVLINNAGFGLLGGVTELDVGEQLNMIDLNVRSLTELTTRFLPAMIARKAGGIINIASIAAFMPGPYMAVYFATKAYVVSYSEALSSELDGTGVTVTCVCPGPVDTGFQGRAGTDAARWSSGARPVSAESVAESGWAAFKAGDRQWLSGGGRFAKAAGRLLPHRFVLPAIRYLQKPSGNQ